MTYEYGQRAVSREASSTVMDELDQLLVTYRAQPAAPASWKLDVLMDLEALQDPRILPFMLEVLLDPAEQSQVRLRVLGHLRDGGRTREARGSVAGALSRLVADRSSPELRLAAALALTEFADIADVVSILGQLARDTAEPPDVRYCAFTSVERAGPSAEIALLMRDLATDVFLGSAARAVLARWKSA